MVKCDECLNGKCDPKYNYHAGQFISDEEYNNARKQSEKS